MNVVVEPLPNCLATLRVEVEPETVSQARASVTRGFGQEARIPGYRPGKAPLAVIERKFKKQIREELERKVLQEATRQAISEKGLRVLHLANIEDVKLGDDNTLSYTATVVTHPDFALPQYKGIAIETKTEPVTDADVATAIEEMRDQAADFQPIGEPRGAEMEDFIVVDYDGAIDGKPVHEVFPKGGKPLSGNRDFWIKMTEEAFFPGFCTALVGLKPGESTTFTVEVPADFPVEGMPGQKIEYTVKLTDIMKKVLPELDDAFAGTMVAGKTMEELRTMTREEVQRQRQYQEEGDKRRQIMGHLLSWVECELPTGMVRQETQRILADIVRENQARGVTEEVLKESEQKLVGSAAHSAREKLKGTFILLRIAEAEGIRLERADLLGRIGQLAQRSNMPFDKMFKELEKRNALDQIQEEILTAKVLEFLVANATVKTAGDPAPATLAAPEPAALPEPAPEAAAEPAPEAAAEPPAGAAAPAVEG